MVELDKVVHCHMAYRFRAIGEYCSYNVKHLVFNSSKNLQIKRQFTLSCNWKPDCNLYESMLFAVHHLNK